MSLGILPQLKQRLMKAGSIVIYRDEVMPGPTLWNLSWDWVKLLENSGLGESSLVALEAKRCPAFIQCIIACLRLNIKVYLTPSLDESLPTGINAKIAFPDRNCERFPPLSLELLNDKQFLQEDVKWILSSSGTVHKKICGLTEENVASVLFSHGEKLNISRASRVMNLLPYGHCFGFILDLLQPLLQGANLILYPNEKFDAYQVMSICQKYGVNHLSGVPLMWKRLLEVGFPIDRIKEGIVGGAPIDSALANQLRGSNLRVGYGQTEASPGILLGSTGDFEESYIGAPLGCDVRVNSEGILEFRGKNLCKYIYSKDLEVRCMHKDTEWHSTADLVEVDRGRYYFKKRLDNLMKAANGKFIEKQNFKYSL